MELMPLAKIRRQLKRRHVLAFLQPVRLTRH
jgi:hypothetical protein